MVVNYSTTRPIKLAGLGDPWHHGRGPTVPRTVNSPGDRNEENFKKLPKIGLTTTLLNCCGHK